MKKQLTETEKQTVKKMAAEGKGLHQIAGALNLTDSEAYCSDDFAVAFAEGRS